MDGLAQLLFVQQELPAEWRLHRLIGAYDTVLKLGEHRTVRKRDRHERVRRPGRRRAVRSRATLVEL